MNSLGQSTGGIRQFSFFGKKVIKPVAVSNMFDALSAPTFSNIAMTPVDPMTPTVFDKILWKTSDSQNHGKSKSKVVAGKHEKYLYNGGKFSLDKFARLNSAYISSQVSLGRIPTSRLMREDDPKLTVANCHDTISHTGTLPIVAMTCDARVLSTVDFPRLVSNICGNERSQDDTILPSARVSPQDGSRSSIAFKS